MTEIYKVYVASNYRVVDNERHLVQLVEMVLDVGLIYTERKMGTIIQSLTL